MSAPACITPFDVVEAQFKSVARSLRDAVAVDPRVVGVPSTKGTLTPPSA